MNSNDPQGTPESVTPSSGQPLPGEVTAASGVAPTDEVPQEGAEDQEEVVVQRPAKKPFYQGGVKQFLKDLIASLDSDDKPTRRMTWLFFASFFSMFLVVAVGVYRVHEMRKHVVKVLTESELDAEYRRVLEEYREADEKLKRRTHDLGRFVIPLKEPRTNADFNLSIVCADAEVCDYIQTHTVEAKSEVTSALIGLTREDFLSIGGKQRVRRRLMGSLSTWIDREYRGARIENIFFTELSIK